MSTKALRYQLMGAAAMILVAAIALTASTFAWLALDKEVNAGSMDVTAHAQSMYMEIHGTGGTVSVGSISGDPGGFSSTGTVTMTGVKVYPSAHTAGMTDPADIEELNTNPVWMEYWYYGYSDTRDNATMNPATRNLVLSDYFNYHVAEITYEIEIQDGYETDTAYDLYVERITIPTDTGITAIICGQDRFQEFNATVAHNSSPVAISDTVTTTPQTIKVYLYIDGNNPNVYLDNIEALTGNVVMVLACYDTDTL